MHKKYLLFQKLVYSSSHKTQGRTIKESIHASQFHHFETTGQVISDKRLRISPPLRCVISPVLSVKSNVKTIRSGLVEPNRPKEAALNDKQ